jgi:uncharacterized protein YecT (DUF1311 family)
MKFLSRLLLCVPLTIPASGQAVDVDECDARQGELERRACYSQAHTEADRQLSDAYRHLMNALADDYERLLFRHAQIAWKRFSDAQCDLETYAYRGDPASSAMRDRCMAEQMEARRRQVEAYRSQR